MGQNVEEKWLQAMSNGEGPQISVMAGALCKHLKSQGKISLFENYKVKFIYLRISVFMFNFDIVP